MQYKALALCVLLPTSLFAQWVVKTRKVVKESKDEHVRLIVNLPVLTGENNPEIRKSINATLGQMSGVDRSIMEANKAIKGHYRHTAKAKSPSEDDNFDEDFPFSLETVYEIGLNDGHCLSIAFTFYSQLGGAATGHTAVLAANFDVSNGNQIKLEDILIPNFDAELRKLFHAELSLISGLFDNWEKSLKTVEFGYRLGKHSVTFYFPKYSLGPGAAGVISINIAYNKLLHLVPQSSPIAYLLKN